jgi:hypothetical protein
MFKIECEGCRHQDADGEHCFGLGIAVKEVSDRECLIAKGRERGIFIITRKEKRCRR